MLFSVLMQGYKTMNKRSLNYVSILRKACAAEIKKIGESIYLEHSG